MSDKKRSGVGTLLMTKEGELVAHLQKRGSWDYRQERPQTWPQVCQVTAEGKRQAKETDLEALRREVMEELGPSMGTWIFHVLLDEKPDKFVLVQNDQTIIYGLVVPIDVFKSIRLEPITGGFVRVTAKTMHTLMQAVPEWKNREHNQLSTVVRPHTKEALVAAFRRFH